MSCRWSLETDLAAALRERQDPRWAAFHAHHPACPDCGSALAPWTRLDALVRAATRELPEWHPPDAALIALLERPGGHSQEERALVARHLDACARCRDALLAVAALPAASFPASVGGAEERQRFGLLRLPRVHALLGAISAGSLGNCVQDSAYEGSRLRRSS